ncbi:MAG TPA: cellulose binding domain-containing protein [Streptosporangiaceae bacterium]|nr:cellulose binding domain-containing protein [Streptosporangiaceae bacterium]
MGRHARLAEREELFEAFEETDEHIRPAVKRRLRWIARVPLLPALAGVGALGIVLAAYGTQQISLNFSDGDNAPPAGQNVAPQQRQDAAAAQDSRAGRGIGRAGAVTVAFRATSKWTDGFEGRATIVNVSGRPITGWTFAFRVPNARVLSIWEVEVVRLGNPVIVRNPPQSPAIAPGESVQIGFTARGAAGTPSACSFNGIRCHIV